MAGSLFDSTQSPLSNLEMSSQPSHNAQRNHIDVPLIVLLTNVLILSPCLQADWNKMLLSHLRSLLANQMPLNTAIFVVAIAVLQAVLDFTQSLKALSILVAIFLLVRPAMVRFPHLRVHHARYDMRGNPPGAPIILQQTAQQRAKDADAALISRSWPIKRANKMSRGLANRANDCFRNSALQMLMHAPKFLNWILSHNVTSPNGTRRFACQKLSATEEALVASCLMENIIPEPGTTPLRACPACAMKRLAEVYWDNMNTGSDGKPSPLMTQTPEFGGLVRIDVALMRFSPGTGVDGQQQDPSEFLTRFLRACLESVDYR